MSDVNRENALALLRTHAVMSRDPHEAAMIEATRAFVEAEPECLQRTCVSGHLTGSAWIVDASRTRTLLTHHRKLDKWLQLGGHADGDPDLAAVAFREAQEESGLMRLRLVSTALFDLDRHVIPARRTEPQHFHYDFRFLIEADPREPLVLSSESRELAWVPLKDVAQLNPEESMLRMVRKTMAGSGAN
jgi:8-oxo-dGTP pyrophosphatase MutT (NUDIX family)